MRSVNNKGFTIIEVVLFLALSALFMGVAFRGVRGRTAAVQFTDSMRSIQSFLVSERNKVQNGVNSASNSPLLCGGTTTGESNNCVLIGRVVTFGQDSDGIVGLSAASVNVLYGDKPSSEDVASKDDITLIDEAGPAVDATKDDYTISWGTEFLPDKSINTGGTGNYDRIGWLRSPGSTRITPIAFDAAANDLNNNLYYRASTNDSKIGDQVETRLCFKGTNGQVASIRFGDGAGASAVELIFDDPECL